MMLTVYSKPSCVQCTMTYRVLEKKGIEYTTVDITTNPAALAYV
ncbi:NrdH-redoxin, partial [Rathayibacter sp. AY1B7]